MLKRDAQNIYVLDLLIRICIDVNNFIKAEKELRSYNALISTCAFPHHRKATLLAAQGHWELALIEAQEACLSGQAPFEAFATKIDILIEMKRDEDALDALELTFRTSALDYPRISFGAKLRGAVRYRRSSARQLDAVTERRLPWLPCQLSVAAMP